MNEDNENCVDRKHHEATRGPGAGDCKAWGERFPQEDDWYLCESCRKFYAQPGG